MQSANSEIQSLSYEQAFAELEEIVYGLETNQKSLEEAIALFERGRPWQSTAPACWIRPSLKVQPIERA